MAIDLKKLEEKFDEALQSVSDENVQMQFANKTPKGWVSIEEYLPMWLAKDIIQGYSVYKVKDKEGKEFNSAVTDHNIWYYIAKESGVTHWYNE